MQILTAPTAVHVFVRSHTSAGCYAAVGMTGAIVHVFPFVTKHLLSRGRAASYVRHFRMFLLATVGLLMSV